MESPKYLQLDRKCLLILGVWNLERKSILYRTYRSVIVGYFCIFLIREIVQLISICGKKNNEIIQNIGALIMTVMAILKGFVCMSSSTDKMIQTIKKREEKMLETQNAEIIKIYKFYIKYKREVLLSYYLVVLMACIFGIYPPIIQGQLPLSVWVPFDTQKHFYAACFIQAIDGCFGCHFMVGTDVLLLSFMIFGICQLKVLNLSAENLDSSEDLTEIHRDHLFVIRYLIRKK